MNKTMNHARTVAEACGRLPAQLFRGDAGPCATGGLRPCALALESVRVAEPWLLEARLAEFGAHSGWLERQSRLALIEDGAWPAPEGDFDAVIAGELAAAEAGMSIRRLDGGWLLTRFADRSDDHGAHLAQEVCLPGVERLPATGGVFGQVLRYRVYWRHEGDAGWRRFAARLLGFGSESDIGSKRARP